MMLESSEMTKRLAVSYHGYKAGLNIGASKFKQVLWYFTNILFFKNPVFIIPSFKLVILKAFGAKIGRGVVIKPSVNIKYPWRLIVGSYTWIGEGVWIDNLTEVFIGSNVCISQGAYLLTGNHNYKKTTFDLIVEKIVVEDGCWIGAKAIVCPGITCKSHSVLSVGSVATNDLEAYQIYAGIPAVRVRERMIEN